LLIAGIRAGLAVVVVALAVAALVGSARSSLPEPDFNLAVAASQDQRVLTYTIHFDNVGGAASAQVVVADQFPAAATYLGDPADVTNGVWTRTYTDVAVGPHSELLSVSLADSVQEGDRLLNVVDLRYVDAKGLWITKTFATEFEVRVSAPPTGPPSVLPWTVLPIAAAVAIGGLVAVRPRRRAKIEQVFLMHSSGRLIHHWAAHLSPSQDIDILSGMFVILKEFVRDSFRGESGSLTELQFGDSRVFLAEATHAVLAAVVSGAHANGIPSEVASAVRDFERRHAPVLAAWNGRLDDLPEAKGVVDGLVHGRYRNWRMT